MKLIAAALFLLFFIALVPALSRPPARRFPGKED